MLYAFEGISTPMSLWLFFSFIIHIFSLTKLKAYQFPTEREMHKHTLDENRFRELFINNYIPSIFVVDLVKVLKTV